MIQLKPEPDNTFSCPGCNSVGPLINEILITSIHVFADCTCRKCGLEFYQVYPVGHGVFNPLSLRKHIDSANQETDSDNYLVNTIYKGIRQIQQNDVEIKKVIFKEGYESIVILNTLDFLYGHVLLKLYNSQYYIDRHKEVGLIIIIPKLFEWLIPKGCAEAWVVDLNFSKMIYGHAAIQNFVTNELRRFNKVFLSRAYASPDFTQIDIERLTGVKPFNLENFAKSHPTVTFVLREDRWWFKNILDYWFYRVARRLRILSWAGGIISLRQNGLVKRTILRIREQFPDADFHIVGLGKSGSFSGYAIDERKTKTTTSDEINWCKIYAKSHVVVGVHGSNMLLPTAQAAGCVEILPSERYSVLADDLSIRYNDRRQLFFYRFVDQYANTSSVADKVIGIIRDYEVFYSRMSVNTDS